MRTPSEIFAAARKEVGRAVDEIFRVGRQFRMAARQLHAGSAALEGQFVAEVHRLHDGFEFVKAVGAFAEDVQDQVDLAGRFFFKTHGDSPKQNAPTECRRRVCAKCVHGQLSKTWNRLPGTHGATSPPLKPV